MFKKLKNYIKTVIVICRNFRTISTGKKIIRIKESHYFYSRHRRLYNYLPNVENRIHKVFSSYGVKKNILEEISELPVVDIGANIGEFSIYLRTYVNHTGNIFAFEPDPIEFKALQKNSFIHNIVPINKAVSNINGVLNFALLNEDADSRLEWDTKKHKNIIKVQSTTLDEELLKHSVSEVGLVKVEAEGYEPEILRGIKLEKLKIKYFAIDCGPERPPNNETTLVECINYLQSQGYTLVNYNHERHAILLARD